MPTFCQALHYEYLFILQTFIRYHAEENNLVVNKINTSTDKGLYILETTFCDSLDTDSKYFQKLLVCDQE